MSSQIIEQTFTHLLVRSQASPDRWLYVVIFVAMSLGLVVVFMTTAPNFYVFLGTLASLNLAVIIDSAVINTYTIDRAHHRLTIEQRLICSRVRHYPLATIRAIVMIDVWSSRTPISTPHLMLTSGKRIRLDLWLDQETIYIMNAYLRSKRHSA